MSSATIHTNHTTPEMIEAARKIAAEIKLTGGVLDAFVNDWGRFGNFSMFIRVANRPDVKLREIRQALVRAVKLHAPESELRKVLMPRRIYSQAGRDRVFSGWMSDGRRLPGYGEVSIDLDFHRYCQETNTFPAVQSDGA